MCLVRHNPSQFWFIMPYVYHICVQQYLPLFLGGTDGIFVMVQGGAMVVGDVVVGTAEGEVVVGTVAIHSADVSLPLT